MTVTDCAKPVGRLVQFARLGFSRQPAGGVPHGPADLLASTTLPQDTGRWPLTRGSHTQTTADVFYLLAWLGNVEPVPGKQTT